MKKHPRTYERMVEYCADCDEELEDCECEDEDGDEAGARLCATNCHVWVPSLDPHYDVCFRCQEPRLKATAREGGVRA